MNDRTAIYARASSETQEHEETVQSQLEALRRYAQEHEIAITEEYVDEGVSGAVLERPALDRLRDQIVTGDVDRVLIYSLDRLARKMVYQALLLEEFRRHNVEVEFVNHPHDDTPAGQLLSTVLGAISEFERASIMERTRRGRKFWASQGALTNGQVPYGYTFVPRNGDCRAAMIIEESEGAVVRSVFDWQLNDGLSCREIAKRLNEQSVPTQKGARWHPTSIQRMLRNETYKGRHYVNRKERIEVPQYGRTLRKTKTKINIRPRDEWIEIAVPAIISVEQWERARKQLELNSRYSPRNNTKREYLLRGLLRCAECESALVGIGGPYPYYRCNSARRKGFATKTCDAKSIKAKSAENAVWEAVSNLLRDPELLIGEFERRRQCAPDQSHDSEIARLNRQRKKLQSAHDRLLDAFQAGAIDLDILKERMNGLKAQIAVVDERERTLESLKVENDMTDAALHNLKAFQKQVAVGLDHLPFQERQQLLQLLVEQIRVDGKRLEVEVAVPIEHGPNGSDGDLRLGYTHHGIREYWIVDPVGKTVEVTATEDGQLVTHEVYGVGSTVRSPWFQPCT